MSCTDCFVLGDSSAMSNLVNQTFGHIFPVLNPYRVGGLNQPSLYSTIHFSMKKGVWRSQIFISTCIWIYSMFKVSIVRLMILSFLLSYLLSYPKQSRDAIAYKITLIETLDPAMSIKWLTLHWLLSYCW